MIENINKDLKERCGIYKITNKINSKYYIGSSSNLFERCYKHIYTLRQNKHDNKHLQFAYNKYGEGSFEIEIIELCNKENQLIIEQEYLNNAKIDKINCYNMKFVAEGSDAYIMHNEETRRKISQSKIGKPAHNKGKPLSEEQKLLISFNNSDLYDIYKDSGEFIETLRGAKNIAEKYNIRREGIYSVIMRSRQSIKGYVLRKNGDPYTDEEIERVKNIKKQRNGFKVAVYNLNNNLLKIIESKSKTLIEYNLGQNTLDDYLSGKLDSKPSGYVFRYLDN